MPHHERIDALATRERAAPVRGSDEDQAELVERRQLDACVGVLLARVAMLDPRGPPERLVRVDEMATECVGSFAWWCRWFLDAWGDDYPLGQRLRDDEIEAFMSAARHSLHDLDPGLWAELLRMFPMLAS